jgi:hypothetical protein
LQQLLRITLGDIGGPMSITVVPMIAGPVGGAC